MAYDKGADSDYSQGFVDAVGTAVRSIFDVSPSDLLDDSEEADMSDDELTEHPDREDDNELAGEGVCEWTYNSKNHRWQSACGESFQFTHDGPEENGFEGCPYCLRPIEIVEEGEEPELEVGDLIKWRGKYRIIIDTEYCEYEVEGEKVGHFEPTDEFFERVPEWVTGELVVSHEHSDGPEITLEVTGGDPNDETILIHGDGNTEIAPEQVIDRTGIILSVSELESVFCEGRVK
jgi:hypothetical protein